MTRSLLTILFVASGIAVVGCQNRPDSPTGPSAEFAVSAEATSIFQLIEGLYPEGGLETAALKQFRNIDRQLGRGRTEAARAQAFTLIEFTLRHHANGRLVDPNGVEAPTMEAAGAELISRILAFVELDGETIPADALGPNGAVVVCRAGAMCNATAGDGLAAFHFPAGVTSENTVVAISPIEPSANPFAAVGLDGFPLYRGFVDVPTLPTDGSDQRAVTVEVCTVMPPHPMAPSEEALERVRMARLVDDGSAVDIAPHAEIPFGFDRPDCTGLDMGLMGGSTSGFGVFGAVDPESNNEPPPPPVTETTTELVLTPAAIFDGTTLTATATVSPAPAAVDAPTVTFVIDRNTVNQRIAVAPVVSGEAAIDVGCLTSSSFPDPQPDVVVGSGAHFIQAEFPGAGILEPSQSSTLILSCL